MIYLDYAASSPPFSSVTGEMCRISMEVYGNPGAIHSAGARARGILRESREKLARLLRVRPEEVFFTSGGTEANNWAVKMACASTEKRHILCSALEHSSVLEPVRRMERQGFYVTYLKPDSSGRISPEAVDAALTADTALLCVQAVNNETGVMQDVDALAEIAHSRGARYLCDGVQSFGHGEQNLHNADLISLSAHKFGGPRGIGCLVIRYPHLLPPLIDGGGQEFGLRSGTENLPAIAGFAMGAELACQGLSGEQGRLVGLTALLESELRKAAPDLRIAGEGAVRSGNILCCAFPGITGEEMVLRLDSRGICASPGAACAARDAAPSHVLLAMGYSPKEAAEFVRFSLGRATTEDQIRQTVLEITQILEKRRGLQ